MESIVLLNWCEQQGFGPLGLTGLSMGGHVCTFKFYLNIDIRCVSKSSYSTHVRF